jgi:hypothetical protein
MRHASRSLSQADQLVEPLELAFYRCMARIRRDYDLGEVFLRATFLEFAPTLQVVFVKIAQSSA